MAAKHYTALVIINEVIPEKTTVDNYGKVKDSTSREVNELIKLSIRDQNINTVVSNVVTVLRDVMVPLEEGGF